VRSQRKVATPGGTWFEVGSWVVRGVNGRVLARALGTERARRGRTANYELPTTNYRLRCCTLCSTSLSI